MGGEGSAAGKAPYRGGGDPAQRLRSNPPPTASLWPSAILYPGRGRPVRLSAGRLGARGGVGGGHSVHAWTACGPPGAQGQAGGQSRPGEGKSYLNGYTNGPDAAGTSKELLGRWEPHTPAQRCLCSSPGTTSCPGRERRSPPQWPSTEGSKLQVSFRKEAFICPAEPEPEGGCWGCPPPWPGCRPLPGRPPPSLLQPWDGEVGGVAALAPDQPSQSLWGEARAAPRAGGARCLRLHIWTSPTP